MTDSRRRVLNCFDRLELLVGNRTPVHGSEAPFLVNVLEAIREEKRIASDLTDPRIEAIRELATGWVNAAWIGDAEEAGPDQWRLLGACGRELLGILDGDT